MKTISVGFCFTVFWTLDAWCPASDAWSFWSDAWSDPSDAQISDKVLGPLSGPDQTPDRFHQTPDPLDQTPRVQNPDFEFSDHFYRLAIRRLIPWIRRLIRFIRRLISSNRCFPVPAPFRFLLGHVFEMHRLVLKRTPIFENKDPLES